MRTASFKSFIGVLLLTLFLGVSAFAQSDSTQPQAAAGAFTAAAAAPDSKLPVNAAFHAAAAPKPQGSAGGRTFEARRFELSIQFGGSVAGNMGNLNLGACQGATNVLALDGCDPNQPLNLSDSDGPYPGRLGGVRVFQRYGGVAPTNGGFGGVRFGINVNPRWQVELIYNYGSNGAEFTNKAVLDNSIASFLGSGFNVKRARFINGRDGSPSGSQHTFLVNINRNFNAGNRVVPYLGAGAGMVRWTNMPSVLLESDTTDGSGGLSQFSKRVSDATGFAFDVAAGVKVYVTDHFGFRVDYMNVTSFPRFTQTFSSVDVNDFLGNGAGAVYPLAGTVEQRGRFTQNLFSGGVFWAFGGGLGADHAGPTGDRESKDDKWEFAVTFGGTRGSTFGNNPQVTCAEAVAAGCDLTVPVDAGGGNGVYEGKLTGALPPFLATGGVKPGDGWNVGFRLGFNFTPHWQVAFIFNHAGTGTKFTNYAQLEQAVSTFYEGWNSRDPRDLVFNGGADGTPRGTQQQFLVNLHYNFQPERRIVPYIGAGAGAVRWMDGPRLSLTQDITGGGSGQIAGFTKTAGDATGFALDLAGGVKLYVSRHFGFRADVLNVISWTGFDHTFQSVDTNGAFTGTPGTIVPMSGTLSQERKAFNQLQATGGVFWTF